MTVVGIDSISFHIPKKYLDADVLAKARGVQLAHYVRGLGVHRMAIPEPHEDPVAMAANAAKKLISRPEYKGMDIGLCVVATETGVDQAKPISSYLSGLIPLPFSCRLMDVKNSCYGGTAALHIAMDWVASCASTDRLALVVCTDISRYEMGTPGEPTQGAGAVAMIISANPRLLELDRTQDFVVSGNSHEFFRPNGNAYPSVRGQDSVREYLRSLDRCLAMWSGANPGVGLSACCYHTPFPSMARKAHFRALGWGNWDEVKSAEIWESFRTHVLPSTVFPGEVGNIYTGSLYLSLASLLHRRAASLEGQIVGLFSFGSGYIGEFFSGKVSTGAGNLIDSLKLDEALSGRSSLDIHEYEAIRSLDRVTDNLPIGSFPVPLCEGVVFLGIDDGIRVYKNL